MKLHLGCGERYLEGYVNVDYPSDDHTIQEKSVADVHQDLLTLRYEKGSIEEVRSHHVFEHFTRAVACALLTVWSYWIPIGGVLHIETPDFDATCRNMLRPRLFGSDKARKVGMRHLFGSEEAFWAIHYTAYGKKEFEQMFKCVGFELESVNYHKWRNTYNINVVARKNKELSIDEMKNSFEKFLAMYCVDDSKGERKMLEVWMNDYSSQVNKQIG